MADEHPDHLTRQVLRRLPAPVREIYVGFLNQPPLPIHDLNALLDDHNAFLEDLENHREFLDMPLARGLNRRCRDLVRHLESNQGDVCHLLVHAAVHYLNLHADADPDDRSLTGFDDDALVVEAVESAVFPENRSDRAVES